VPVKIFDTTKPCRIRGPLGFFGKVTEKTAQDFTRDPGGRQGRKKGPLRRL